MVSNVELTLFHSGYCTAHAAIVDPELGRGKSRFYAVWALIKHAAHGYILFDTGYHPRFYEATKKFPGKFYAWATPVFIEQSESAVERLQSIGIKASEINYLILSHFHADHIGGLLDFPKAKLVCSAKALQEAKTKQGISAVRKGILKSLLPKDLEERIIFPEMLTNNFIETTSGLKFYDLFQDGSIQLIDLPGHACGMIGALLQTQKEKILLASDTSWSDDTFARQVLPSKWSNLFFDSWNDYCSTFKKLFLYHQNNPEVKILFTHCPDTLLYCANHV
ncbi:MAG TPA: MBL fold metallo-hydrolase [Cytophagaceae bacterium]|jgi:glyoxylase-like metal-dependent hydrolase (beta-lactamase superfamily II)|nr:MBL fold metallo-hydrolase [Cytophagaceae bacterium]